MLKPAVVTTPAVAMLDGGLARWVAEGRPTRQGEEANAPGTFVPQAYPGLLVPASPEEN
jgi:3-mercaptopyruvate sulfurtransferase SseA